MRACFEVRVASGGPARTSRAGGRADQIRTVELRDQRGITEIELAEEPGWDLHRDALRIHS